MAVNGNGNKVLVVSSETTIVDMVRKAVAEPLQH